MKAKTISGDSNRLLLEALADKFRARAVEAESQAAAVVAITPAIQKRIQAAHGQAFAWRRAAEAIGYLLHPTGPAPEYGELPSGISNPGD